MSRSSSRLSQRHTRPQSTLSRPKTAAPCLTPEAEAVFEEEALPSFRPHTSFHYFPEGEGDVGISGVDMGCSTDPSPQPLNPLGDSDPEAEPDPEPMKFGKEHGFGFRKPEKELSPHWSQWPQPPKGQKPRRPLRPKVTVATPLPAYITKSRKAVQHFVHAPVINGIPFNATTMTSRMKYSDERNIIMHRGLSPRRAAPPVMPGRSLTQYGSFGGNRDYIGGLDLCNQSYNGYRGYQPATSRCSSRESRPMHRHLRAGKQEEGYLHNNSIYYSTTPNVSGYFIIHPDWVSERLSMRRSQSLLAF